MKKVFTGFIVMFCFVHGLLAQKDARMIFRMEPGAVPSVLSFYDGIPNRSKAIQPEEIFRSLDIYALWVPQEHRYLVLKNMEKDEDVIWVTEDIPLETRETPNDEYFGNQWYLPQIRALDGWDITQGGVTPLGDTIVVAVLDDGFYTDHTDLQENIWKNLDEIPGDQIDNDGNGYVDDYEGLNVGSGTGQHSVKKHGTAVAGIIGAKGNNDIGTAGINWNVKLMLVSEANTLANVIEAYQYILDMREKYNHSNGTSGAYVVATNLSAGIDGVFPGDNPSFMIWCDIYDKLGQAGILNVNATTNTNTNIDVEGDMPGSCASEYLITVTNSDKNDRKVEDAGYGINFVDLAAPGSDIFTTSLANNYESFNGASSSAPQVTGAIALLYAAPCADFAEFAINNPQSGAQNIRTMILSGVDKNTYLESLVKSGGRLNILNAMELMRQFCGGTTGELEILSISPNPVSNNAVILYETMNFEPHQLELRNMLGQLIWSKLILPPFFGEKQYFTDIRRENLNLKYLIDLPNGVYILSLRQDKQIASRQIIYIQ